MTDEQIMAAIVAAVRLETGDPDLVLHGSTTAADVPGWDSLAHTRIILELGVALGVAIDVEATYRAATIADLVTIVRQSVLD